MFLISGADRILENVTEGPWDGTHSRGVIKTQKVVSEMGRGCLQTFEMWSLPPVLADACLCLIKRGGGWEVGLNRTEQDDKEKCEPQGDQPVGRHSSESGHAPHGILAAGTSAAAAK